MVWGRVQKCLNKTLNDDQKSILTIAKHMYM